MTFWRKISFLSIFGAEIGPVGQSARKIVRLAENL